MTSSSPSSAAPPTTSGRRLVIGFVVVLLLLAAFLCSGIATGLLFQLSMGAERGAAGLQEDEVVVDGVALKVLTRPGAPGAPTALLIHGFAADKDNWTRFSKWVPTTWRLVVPDLAGFGDSEHRLDVHHDIRAQTERVHQLLVAENSGPVVVVGNSMGGHIASALALLHPQDVRGLVLIDAAGVTPPELSEVQKAFAAGKNPLVVEDVADFDRLLALIFVTPPEVPRPVKTFFAERAAKAREFNEHIFAEFLERPFLLDGRLGDIHAPTLVIWGENDRVLLPSAAKVFVDGIPGATLSLMPHTGHAPMIEHPEETARLVTDFVASLPH